MTNEELNRWAHETVLGKCLHKWKLKGCQFYVCEKCQRQAEDEFPPNSYPWPYNTDLNAVRLVAEKTIEQFGWYNFGIALLAELGEAVDGDLDVYELVGIAPSATAEQYLRACYAAYVGEGGEKDAND